MNSLRLTEKDLANAKNLSCDECSHEVFTSVYLLKSISALMSPNGQEINTPVPTFACAKCGHINKKFLPGAQE